MLMWIQNNTIWPENLTVPLLYLKLAKDFELANDHYQAKVSNAAHHGSKDEQEQKM